MSGRHRKPTTSSIGVAKIVVTGAVLGGSSLGLAGQAQAATDSEWDVVASCESSGNWSINTGNGYHGGLQFAPSTWLGFGGGQFASAAHMATRDEQIAIAEKVLAGQGKGAWPTCGRGLSGLTQRDVPADTVDTVDTDVVVTPLVDPADTPTPAAALDAPLPAAPAEPQRMPGDADEPLPVVASVPAAVATTAPAVVTSPKVASAPAAPVVTQTSPPKAATKPSAATAATSAPTTAGPDSYKVAKGDNPYNIAKKLGVNSQELLKLNGIEDPTKLQIGQVLKVPGKSN
jgi:LysM repeat protein